MDSTTKPNDDDKLRKTNALSRLRRDLMEWERNKDEITTVSASPLDNNIFEWHVNIVKNKKIIIIYLYTKFTCSKQTKSSFFVLFSYFFSQFSVFKTKNFFHIFGKFG